MLPYYALPTVSHHLPKRLCPPCHTTRRIWHLNVRVDLLVEGDIDDLEQELDFRVVLLREVISEDGDSAKVLHAQDFLVLEEEVGYR